jgi:hypothetical protein
MTPEETKAIEELPASIDHGRPRAIDVAIWLAHGLSFSRLSSTVT